MARFTVPAPKRKRVKSVQNVLSIWWLAAVVIAVAALGCSDDSPDFIDVGVDVGDAASEQASNHGGDSKGDHLDDVDVGDAEHSPDASLDASSDAGSEAEAGFPFTLYCGEAVDGAVELEFEIESSTSAYTLVPLAYDEQSWIEPQNITTPGGEVIDFQGDNSFQIYGLHYPGFEWITAITIPAAPNFVDQLEHGLHSLHVHTGATDICYYLMEMQAVPVEIDLNIYLLGLDGIGLNAESAPTHPDFQSVLSSLEDIYDQVGLSLGEVRYPKVSDSLVDMYRVIHEESDIYELLAHSEYPGHDIDSALSVNLFITEQFVYEAIGLAMGIPGIPGYHESLVSGVAMTGEYIGGDPNNNLFTAIAMAHEVGHFLGLFHTSETDGQGHDRLDDTPQCYDLTEIWDCPDAQNVMFPYIDYDTLELTQDQGYVMRVNPLTK